MGHEINTKNKIVRFAHLDTILDDEGRVKSEVEYVGEAEIVSAYHHDGVRDGDKHHYAHLICAYNEQGEEFLNYGCDLAEAMCESALQAFYYPPQTPILFPHEHAPVYSLVQIEDAASDIIAVGSLPIIANETDRAYWGCKHIQRITLVDVGRHVVECAYPIPAGIYAELNELAAKMAA